MVIEWHGAFLFHVVNIAICFWFPQYPFISLCYLTFHPHLNIFPHVATAVAISIFPLPLSLPTPICPSHHCWIGEHYFDLLIPLLKGFVSLFYKKSIPFFQSTISSHFPRPHLLCSVLVFIWIYYLYSILDASDCLACCVKMGRGGMGEIGDGD